MAKKAGDKYIEGIGRRKTSTARVRLYEGEGRSTINGKPFEEVYTDVVSRQALLSPLDVTESQKGHYFTASVRGGGVKTGQLEAIQLGLARALAQSSDTHRAKLRQEGFLTRDSRMKERKKYYHVKARKSPQYSKR